MCVCFFYFGYDNSLLPKTMVAARRKGKSPRAFEAAASLELSPESDVATTEIEKFYKYDRSGIEWEGEAELTFVDSDEVQRTRKLQFISSGTFGGVYGYRDEDIAFAIKLELLKKKKKKKKKDDECGECPEAEISQELDKHECASNAGVLQIRCLYSDEIKYNNVIFHRNVYLMPLMDGKVKKLFDKTPTTEKKRSILLKIIRDTKKQLECMFAAGRPYVDLKNDNLMYVNTPEGCQIYIVDFGSMHSDGGTLSSTYPLPSSKVYLVPVKKALEKKDEWIQWQLGVVAYQIAVGGNGLNKWYSWSAREDDGMRTPPPQKHTIQTEIKEKCRALGDDVAEFICAALIEKESDI